jgi:hypothetical protein
MTAPTLPGTIPGLLRRGSPVVSTVTDDAWPHGESCVGIMPYKGQSGLVHNVSPIVPCCTVLFDDRPGGLVQMARAWVALDLSDPTGRAHAAWWYLRAKPDPPAEVDALAFFKATISADMTDAEIDRLRLACLYLAGPS